MFKGFYTVASGMLAQQRRTEMLTNNMSNANTPGYKADQAGMRAFPENYVLYQYAIKEMEPWKARRTYGQYNTLRWNPYHRKIAVLAVRIEMQLRE